MHFIKPKIVSSFSLGDCIYLDDQRVFFSNGQLLTIRWPDDTVSTGTYLDKSFSWAGEEMGCPSPKGVFRPVICVMLHGVLVSVPLDAIEVAREDCK